MRCTTARWWRRCLYDMTISKRGTARQAMATVTTCSAASSARRPAVLPTDAKRYHNRRELFSGGQPELFRAVRLQSSYASESFRAGDWQITDQVHLRVNLI
jgi:hypothetical protein